MLYPAELLEHISFCYIVLKKKAGVKGNGRGNGNIWTVLKSRILCYTLPRIYARTNKRGDE